MDVVPKWSLMADIAVVGMGKLGFPLAAVLASYGHQVVGVDASAEVRDRLAHGGYPPEPGLVGLLADTSIELTGDFARIAEMDASFVVVPTPSDGDGWFDPGAVVDAVRSIGEAVRRGSRYHMVVVVSTVMPGTTRGPVLQALEDASGRKVGEGLGLCYSPEFIALGSVIADLQEPDMLLVGASDPVAATKWCEVMCCSPFSPVLHVMSFENAELAKLAVNAFVTMKISFSNQLSLMCEQMPGGDAHQIAQAIGDDRRIGARYLKPGGPFGGPCFPRDNRAFAMFARTLHTTAPLAEATDRINANVADMIVSRVMDTLSAEPHFRSDRKQTVAVLGLAYKLGTPVTTASIGMMLVEQLLGAGFDVCVHDPDSAVYSEPLLAHGNVLLLGDPEMAYHHADVVVATLPAPEYLAMIPPSGVAMLSLWDTDSPNVHVLGRGSR